MADIQEAPRQTRFQRLFGFLAFPQLHRSAKGDAVVEMPPRGISTDALDFAETALKGIPIAGARVEISAVLNIIKGFSIAPTLNEKSLDQLENHVRLLAELLEPLSQMESHQFSGDLQHQLRKLGRELHAISLRMKKSGSSTINRRLSVSKRNENVNNVSVFARDFGLALDSFRATALPMYPISTIEAVMHPSGIVSNSSGGLIPFLDWILQSEVADDRIGAVKTIQLYNRNYKFPKSRYRDRGHGVSNPVYEFLHIGLLNERGIENWIEIEFNGTSTRGTVTVATTKEALIRGAGTLGTLFVEDTLPVTNLARQIRPVCNTPESEAKGQFRLGRVFETLKPYGRYVLDNPPDPQAVALFKVDAWSPWTVTSDISRRPA